MKSIHLLFAACLALGCALAQAGDAAYAVRPTQLKAKPYTDAATLATLPAGSPVEIVARQGSWNQIRASGQTGWVKMLSLRLGSGAQRRYGDSGIKSVFSIASTGSSGSTVTTGVRGLSEEKLYNPHPNPQALQQLHGLAVSRGEAQQFAASAKLRPEQMGYLPAPPQ